MIFCFSRRINQERYKRNFFVFFVLVELKLKRKREVKEYWEKIDSIERKQINSEIDRKTHEELIKRDINVINEIFISDILQIQKK